MRNIFLLVLLVIASNSAMAGWTIVGSFNNSAIYADPSTIGKNGNIVKMWMLYDYKEAEIFNNKSYLSEKYQVEFDCQKKLYRVTAFSWHSGNMGKGEVTYFTTQSFDWIPDPLGSITDFLSKSSCGRK